MYGVSPLVEIPVEVRSLARTTIYRRCVPLVIASPVCVLDDDFFGGLMIFCPLRRLDLVVLLSFHLFPRHACHEVDPPRQAVTRHAPKTCHEVDPTSPASTRRALPAMKLPRRPRLTRHARPFRAEPRLP